MDLFPQNCRDVPPQRLKIGKASQEKTYTVKAMKIEVIKLELIQWILLVQDVKLLNKIQTIKENSVGQTSPKQPRQFGCGKGIFSYVADDFDATPPGFEDYMLP